MNEDERAELVRLQSAVDDAIGSKDASIAARNAYVRTLHRKGDRDYEPTAIAKTAGLSVSLIWRILHGAPYGRDRPRRGLSS